MLKCLVILEGNNNELAAASLRLMARLRRFSGRSEARIVAAGFGGDEAPQILRTCGGYGLEEMYQVEGVIANDPKTWIPAIIDLIHEQQISLIILPGTPIGRELAPNLAVQLDAGIVANCQEIIFSQDGLEAVVEAYNKQYQFITSLEGIQNVVIMSDIDPGMVEPLDEKECALTKINAQNAGMSDVKIMETYYLPAGELDIAEAERIVGIGRGVENRADLEQVLELATVVDAAIAGTRPAVDAGHIPFSRQIGQTGRIVAPQLYFAMGISGAPQHITGVIDAKIVAINNDPKAPILRLADLGVVGDFREIVPCLVKRLKENNQMNAGKAGR
ncbi:MAG: electron transfer flavoprotein subunit alpha/FixB family protein [Syntrophomonas sp.]